jgi:hypothetical protein
MKDILNELGSLSEKDLLELNNQIIRKLKLIRAAKARAAKSSLASGDKVSWNGRRGYTEGTILRIKQKKAICVVGIDQWDVPLNMLKKVS